MRLKPLHDNVVVERLVADTRTPGGIVLPDIAKERPDRGKVLAVGPGRAGQTDLLVPMTVKVGDEVLFTRYAGNETEIDDKKLIIMPESGILAVVGK